MENRATKLGHRVIALLLTVVMVLGMLPTAVFAAGNDITITVKDENGKIAGASVRYTISVDGEAVNPEAVATTNEDGVASIDMTAQAEAIAAGSSVTVDYTVSAEGYDDQSGSIEGVSLGSNTNVDLTKTKDEFSESETVTLTINKSGSGTVKINDNEVEDTVTVNRGEKVKVEVIPANDGGYIKELTVAGVSKTVEHGKSFEDEITLEEDASIVVTFSFKYTVEVDAEKGGTVALNDKIITKLSVESGEIVKLVVTPNTNYIISSITIGGNSETITDPNSFNEDITISADTTISVTFARSYTVTISYNENGSVSLDDVTVDNGGTVTIAENSDAPVIYAKSIEGFRISSVKIDGIEQISNDVTYEFTKTLEPNEDYTDYIIEVTFAQITYNVDIVQPQNGTIVTNPEIAHGGKLSIMITPEIGYTINKIMINGSELSEETLKQAVEQQGEGDDSVTIGVENVTEAQNIHVTFKEAAKASLTDVSFTAPLRLDQENLCYIYAPGKTVLVSSKRDGHIRINYAETIKDGTGADYWSPEKNTTIESIELFYADEKNGETFKSWHSVPLEKEIKIVFDATKPTLKLTPDAANYFGYYNSDVKVGVYATDGDDYSGIKTVEYQIVCDGKVTQEWDTIYPYNDDEEIKAEWGTDENNKIIVDAETNNSRNVTLTVRVTDRAGQYTDEILNLKILTLRPYVEVSVNGERHEEAADAHYNTARTATIKIREAYEEVFNENSAEIKYTINGGEEETITDFEWVRDKTEENTYIAEVTFGSDLDENGIYHWDFSYTNKALLSPETIVVAAGTEAPFDFVVDKQAPEAVIKVSPLSELLIEVVEIFGFKNFKTEVGTTISVEDVSDVYDALYYKSNFDDGLSSITDEKQLFDALETLYKNGKFTSEPITVVSAEQFEIYARVTDYAGNTCYVSTGGVIVDLTKSEIELVVEESATGVYGGDIPVTIKVTDPKVEDIYSGIRSVTYKIESKGQVTKTQTVVQGNKQDYWEVPIEINAKDNNSDNVKLTVTAKDAAGNESDQVIKSFKINTTKPTVKISMSGTKKENAQDGYYTARTAEITITNQHYAFDEESAYNAISITAKNGNGVTVKDAYTISEWVHDGNKHTATITFNAGANYKWSFGENKKYMDKSGHTADKAVVTDENVDEHVYEFTVDTSPAEYVSASIGGDVWYEVVKYLTFGLYDRTSIVINAIANDETSPVVIEYYVHYYEDDSAALLSEERLTEIKFSQFNDYTESNHQNRSLSVYKDKSRFIVYFKVTDYAGNIRYVSTNGAIVDKSPSEIILMPKDAYAEYGTKYAYNGKNVEKIEIDVTINEVAPETCAGIDTAAYRIIKDGNIDDASWVTMFDFDIEKIEKPEKPEYADLVKSFEYTIELDPKQYNSSDVVVEVITEDNAGNEATSKVFLDIDITYPEVKISYNDSVFPRNECYFKAERTATIVIKERANHFDPVAAKEGIEITAKDAAGASFDIVKDEMVNISDWKTLYGETPDEDIHTATVTFSKDANYTFKISYSDAAGNASAQNSAAPDEFTVDTMAPTGSLNAKAEEEKPENNHEATWENTLITDANFTLGFWSGKKITITGTFNDVTSPIESVVYYKTDADTALSESQLKTLDKEDWKAFEPIVIVPNEQATVYLKITDYAGHVRYISTNGMIVDNTAPREEVIAPAVTINPPQPVNGLYNGDVKVDIKVVDPVAGGTYSGLKTVTYRVLNMGEETQSGTLYDFGTTNPIKNNLKQEVLSEIVVDSKLNNSNDVVIEVSAIDNVGNSSVDSVAIQVDITAPKISISYNNNSADSGKYYKAERVATITVTERNFRPEDVVIKIKNTDGAIPAISDWTTKIGTGNGDDTTRTATIRYAADGDYTFDIAYTDLANNACPGETYVAGTSNATEFTIDKTAPAIRVSYDNNAAANGKYFNAARTATITVTEHNFDANRVKITRNAGRGGAAPGVSWSHSGDSHVATLRYAADGDYTFDITMTDMAGNASGAADYSNSVAAKDFVIDTVFDGMITVDGVENGKAYGFGAKVVPSVKINDINLDDYDVTLTGVQMNQKINLTKQVNDLLKNNGGTISGIFDIFKTEQNLDGIYTLRITSQDLAGNQDSEEIVFTVNRFGSVYVYNDTLQNLISNGGNYVQSVNGDLVITEYNADKLLANSQVLEITCDGRPLENVAYTVTPDINQRVAVGTSGWYEYTYTISKDNFAADGVYKISVSSKDATGNTPENNNYEDMVMVFRVDSAAPEISSITGLEEEIINATQSDVTYTIFDTIGLKSIAVYVNGELLGDVITDFTEDMNNYFGSFTLTERNEAQTVRIVVEDIAGNITDTDLFGVVDTAGNVGTPMPAYAFNKSVTVSTNILVRWYASTGLFWGSVVGAVALIGCFWVLIAATKKKKERKTTTVS